MQKENLAEQKRFAFCPYCKSPAIPHNDIIHRANSVIYFCSKCVMCFEKQETLFIYTSKRGENLYLWKRQGENFNQIVNKFGGSLPHIEREGGVLNVSSY
jgi:ribosomal protein L37AE/L43A